MADGTARIVYVGHATVLVELDGMRLLTDPLLRRRVTHLRRLGTLDPEPLHDIDVVLLSHLHFDHLDLPSLRRLGRKIPLFVPRGAAGLLRRLGFRAVTEIGAGDELEIGPLTIRGTRAVHPSARVPVLGARADPIGHLILGSRSVYFAGDTDVFDELASLAPVDVALLPVAGWGSSLGPGHMDPRRAAEAARLLRASIAIPIHWGTYSPMQLARGAAVDLDKPATDFVRHAQELAPGVDVRVLRPGEETAL